MIFPFRKFCCKYSAPHQWISTSGYAGASLCDSSWLCILISSSVDTIDESMSLFNGPYTFPRDIQLMLFHIPGIYPTNFEFLSNKWGINTT